MNKRLISINPNQLPGLFLVKKGQLPQTPAIYFLCSKEGILYIGQAKNLNDRWSGNKHHVYRKLREYDRTACWLRWLDCPEPFLDSIEKELVGYYQPPLNQRLKAVEAPPKPVSKPKKTSTTKRARSSPKAAKSKAQTPMESFREYARSCANSRIFYPGI